jgi:hypothetical protein
MLKNTRLIRIRMHPTSTIRGRIDVQKVDATTEAEIEAQIIEDAKEADAEFLINKLLNFNSLKINK